MDGRKDGTMKNQQYTGNPSEVGMPEKRIQECLKERDYDGVLENLGELAKRRVYDPEAFYAGAYAYFMQGDYERAATWVNNTLTYAPGHVAARILLARLCILEDRTTEALAVLDLLLGAGELGEDARREIREIVGYYGRTKKEMVCRDYPNIASFLQIGGAEGEEDAQISPVEKAPKAPTDAGVQAARQKLQEVEEMSCSLKEKAQILSSFAGAWYFDGDLPAAKLLLEAVLRMDSGDSTALRGLALVAAASGDRDKALRYAACIQPTDFLLLETIRGMCGEKK